ncbi:MAG: DUF3047 domain-containing protein [Pseudomonadota bacterium]
MKNLAQIGKAVLLGIVLSAPGFCLNAAPFVVPVGEFSKGKLNGWETKEFEGKTAYVLAEVDGKRVLRAESRRSASGLVRNIRVDLHKTPFLNWRWRAENILGDVDERSKAGDDYPARIYVVVSGGLAFWRTRAVNYVWATRLPEGATWENAFAGKNAMMVAVESGDRKLAVWVREKRDVRADLRRFYGEDIRYIDAVALMTDTDNSNGHAVAYYGDIFFSAE